MWEEEKNYVKNNQFSLPSVEWGVRVLNGASEGLGWGSVGEGVMESWITLYNEGLGGGDSDPPSEGIWSGELKGDRENGEVRGCWQDVIWVPYK